MSFLLLFPRYIPLPDGGLRYTETNMSHLIPEPLNTLSSCLFIVLAIYWALKLRKETRQYIFLFCCTLILFIGSIGGTLYHGLRRYHIFLVMDYMPIMILCLLAGIYFLVQVTRKWYVGVLVLIIYFVSIQWLRTVYSTSGRHILISINYAVMAGVVLVPTLFYLAKLHFRNWKLIAAALASFCIALYFRIADPQRLLPAGTHFLWHLFGALATALMFRFIYVSGKDDQDKVPGSVQP